MKTTLTNVFDKLFSDPLNERICFVALALVALFFGSVAIRIIIHLI